MVLLFWSYTKSCSGPFFSSDPPKIRLFVDISSGCAYILKQTCNASSISAHKSVMSVCLSVCSSLAPRPLILDHPPKPMGWCKSLKYCSTAVHTSIHIHPPMLRVVEFAPTLVAEQHWLPCFLACLLPAQPATVACKMKAQSEHVHVAYMFFLHVLYAICMLSRCLATKISASELRRKIIRECVVGWVGETASVCVCVWRSGGPFIVQPWSKLEEKEEGEGEGGTYESITNHVCFYGGYGTRFFFQSELPNSVLLY